MWSIWPEITMIAEWHHRLVDEEVHQEIEDGEEVDRPGNQSQKNGRGGQGHQGEIGHQWKIRDDHDHPHKIEEEEIIDKG